MIKNTLILIALIIIFNSTNNAQSLNNSPNDVKPSSVLFFNRYTSNFTNPQQSDTQINLTNYNQNTDTTLRLFLIDGASCSSADFSINLTPNQTMSFLVSDYDPGVFGYILVVAVNRFGNPYQFNWIAGTSYIKEDDGRQAILPALGISKLSPNEVSPLNGELKLRFNGSDYEKLPSSLAVQSFDSQVLTSSWLYVYSPSSNLYFGEVSQLNIFTLLFNDVEKARSLSFAVICYRGDSFSSVFNRGSALNNHVPSGRSGWLKLVSYDGPILGSVITRNTMFQGGYNLSTLSLHPDYGISLPY